jgi:hypothetical protein
VKNIDFDFTEQGLYIKNFPDAEKVIQYREVRLRNWLI